MKYLNFKLLFFLAALVLAIPPAWAETVTVTVTKTVNELVSQYGWVNGGGDGKCYTSFNLDEFTYDLKGSAVIQFDPDDSQWCYITIKTTLDQSPAEVVFTLKEIK